MAVRIAAVGDIHYFPKINSTIFENVKADALLLAGDLTDMGVFDDLRPLMKDLLPVTERMPVVAVLGNHDYATDMDSFIVPILEGHGITVLGYQDRPDFIELSLKGTRVGIAGVKGYMGGFEDRCADFGEPLTRRFMAETQNEADRLENGLYHMPDADTKIALMHYAPIEGTIKNERKGVWGWLGSSRLKEAAVRGGADLILHGHAHQGPFAGKTGVVPVRNVAYDVVVEEKKRPLAYFTHQGGRRWSDS